jgi:alpha-glucosidase
MTGGPMDFSLGFFQTVLKNGFHSRSLPVRAPGTRCRQMAMYVVYESPLQTIVENLENYGGLPETAFLKNVPTVWDRSVVLDADVGGYLVMARKRGKEWYIGAITDWNPREIRIPLSFLEEGTYSAEIYSDRANIELNPMAVLLRNTTVSGTDVLNAPLGPGGGYAVRLIPN